MPSLRDGAATTQFIPTHFARIEPPQADAGVLALAAVLWFEASARRHGHDPARTWSSSGAISWPLRLETGGAPADLTVSVLGPRRYRIAGAAQASDRDGVSPERGRRGEVPPRRRGAPRRVTPSPATPCISRSGSLDLGRARDALRAARIGRVRRQHRDGGARAHERQGRRRAGGGGPGDRDAASGSSSSRP